jgi:hypothetical protein
MLGLRQCKRRSSEDWRWRWGMEMEVVVEESWLKVERPKEVVRYFPLQNGPKRRQPFPIQPMGNPSRPLPRPSPDFPEPKAPILRGLALRRGQAAFPWFGLGAIELALHVRSTKKKFPAIISSISKTPPPSLFLRHGIPLIMAAS